MGMRFSPRNKAVNGECVCRCWFDAVRDRNMLFVILFFVEINKVTTQLAAGGCEARGTLNA